MILLLTSRVKCVNVNAQVDRLVKANTVLDPLNDAISADRVNLTSLDNLEAAVAIVLVVGGSRQRRADAGVDVGVVGEETFLCGVEKVGAVVDGGLFAGSSAENLGLPRITL